MIKACLDLGSNTFLLLIVEVKNREIVRVLADESRSVRLAEKVFQTGKLGESALKRADRCFAEFHEIIQKHQAQKVVAVATSAARDAKNGERLLALGRKYDIPISTIGGYREVQLTFLGTFYGRSEADQRQSVVIDIGGGSTEVVTLGEHKQLRGCSIDLGSVRLFERWQGQELWSPSDLKDLDAFILAQLQAKAPPIALKKNWFAVAGTPTTLAAMDQGIGYDPQRVHNYSMSVETIERWRNRLAAMSFHERSQIKGMDAARADVIVCGLSILSSLLRFFKAPQVTASVRGVRYGLAFE